MKKIIVILIILVVTYFIYEKYYKSDQFEIRDQLVVSQSSGLDINSAAPTPPPKFGYIEGTIENKSEKAFIGALISYAVGGDTVFAGVGFVMPGGIAKFQTIRCLVRTASSGYSLIEVKYTEAEN